MTKKQGPGRQLEVIRAELMEDAETRHIADMLGLEIGDYVEMVLGYVAKPDQEPQLSVVDEAKLAEEGFELDVPSVDEMMQWLQDVEDGEIRLGPEEIKTAFTSAEAAARRKARAAAGADQPELAPWMGDEGSGLIEAPDDIKGRLIKTQIQREATKARTKGAPAHLAAEMERARATSAEAEMDEDDDDEDDGMEAGASSAAGSGASLKQRLRELKEAYDDGLLTKAEFARKKAKLLKDL